MKTLAKDTTKDLHDGRVKYTKKIDLSLHYHSEIELIYLANGKLDIFTENGTMHLTRGDIAVFRPLDLHRLDPMDEDNTYLLAILPSNLSLKLSAENIKSRQFRDVPVEIIKVLKMYKMFTSLAPNYKEQYFNLVAEVIKDLYKVTNTSSNLANIILEYIHANYREDITLSSVANACMTNRSYVSKTINSLTGYTFNNYINKLRIAYFLDNFTSNNMLTIDALARESGFNNPRTFYRAFTKELQCSPNDYIKKNTKML